MAFDWKKVVGSIAPTIGTMLGGPLFGMVISEVGEALGMPGATEEQLKAKVEEQGGRLTGDQIVALKTAEQAVQIRNRELDLDVMKINAATDAAEIADVQDARKRQIETKDNVPAYILAGSAVLYALQYVLFYFGPPIADDFIQTLVIKAFAVNETILTAAVFFYIGTSRGSKRSGDTVRQLAIDQQKVIADNAAAP